MNYKTVHGPMFVVSVPDVHRIMYAEGDMIIYIEIEGTAGSSGPINWLVYSDTLRNWEHPYESAEISQEKRKEILESISQSLDILKMPHQLIQMEKK